MSLSIDDELFIKLDDKFINLKPQADKANNANTSKLQIPLYAKGLEAILNTEWELAKAENPKIKSAEILKKSIQTNRLIAYLNNPKTFASLKVDFEKFIEFDPLLFINDTNSFSYSKSQQNQLLSAKLSEKILTQISQKINVTLEVSTTLTPPENNQKAFEKIINEFANHQPLELNAIYELAQILGSVLLLFALLKCDYDENEIWQAAHLEELINEQTWGEDKEAMDRRENHFQNFQSALKFLKAVSS